MATNTTEIDAPTSVVFDVLKDPGAYVRWVVGGRRLRAVDEGWPAPGTSFHHEVGVPPILIRDHTKVLELVEGRRIVLEAKARPMGTAKVTIEVAEAGPGRTRVVLDEVPLRGPARLVPRVVFDPVTKARNTESLRRLKKIAEDRARQPAG